MREVLDALIEDTTRQMVLLQAAIQEQDITRCVRLAHYSKGACANVGAQSVAGLLQFIESKAASQQFPECQTAFAQLAHEVDRLRSATLAL